VATQGKGKFDYEDKLIAAHKKELRRFTFERHYPEPFRRDLLILHSIVCTRETITKLYVHPMVKFLDYLTSNRVDQLMSHTSSKMFN